MWFLIPLVLAAVLLGGSGTSRASGRSFGPFGPGGKPRTVKDAPEFAKSLASKWSKVFGVPSAMILAIMGNESDFNPNPETNMSTNKVVEKGGAWGLMQVLLSTATGLVDRLKKSAYAKNAEVVKTLKLWTGVPSELKNHDVNVMLATYYLKLISEKFKTEDMDIVASAYNMGPGNLQKWLAANHERGTYPNQGYVSMALTTYRKYA